MAKQLAALLGYVFVDSGAMYRAITLYFLENKIDFDNEENLNLALQNIQLSFVWNDALAQSEIYLNGKNIAQEIRTMEVANKVSEVATLPAVRHFAVAQQQKMGIEKGIVMDGRDIGTVVFPNAELKIFVTASIDIRTQRRYDELKTKNPSIDIEEVRENLLLRDHIDSTRNESPLRQADDALLLDNSDMNRDEQLQLVMKWARERME